MNFLIKVWRDPVGSKVIATGIIGLLLTLTTFAFNLWTDVLLLLKFAWSFISSNTSTPNSLLILMAIPCILFLRAIFYSLIKKEIKTTAYIKDHFEGLNWSWGYQKENIINLHCLCPKCQYQIIPKGEYQYPNPSVLLKYTCEECGYQMPTISLEQYEFEGKIRLKIQQKIRTGAWIKALNT
jgi:hypothetical protein